MVDFFNNFLQGFISPTITTDLSKKVTTTNQVTTNTQNTSNSSFTDSRSFQIITNSPNSSQGVTSNPSTAFSTSPTASLIPSVSNALTGSGTPASSGGSSTGSSLDINAIILYGALGLGGYFIIKALRSK